MRGLGFDDFTFLKRSEKRIGRRVRLWKTTKGSHVALYPNLNANDPGWRRVLRDPRFRRALSLAIDRREINLILYRGFAVQGNNTVDESSPLFRRELRNGGRGSTSRAPTASWTRWASSGGSPGPAFAASRTAGLS